jgi:hypothetical protein
MKTKIQVLVLGLALSAGTASAIPIGTDFIYQGRLDQPSGPASGSYDFTFTLNLAATGGTPIVTVTNLNVAVSNGLFTTDVDFGGGIYNGNAYWVQLGVRSNGVATGFAPLTPRQPLTPVPNASYASLAGTVQNGAITSAKLSIDSVTTLALVTNAVTAAKIAPGQVVKTLNGLRDDVVLSAGPNMTITPSGNTLTLGTVPAWQLGGNAGTTPGSQFVGTSDNQSLFLKVNNLTALRIDPAGNGPNIVGGLAAIHPTFIGAGVRGAVVAGGGSPAGPVTGLGGGDFHAIYDSDGAIGGGFGNKVGNGNADVGDAAFGTVSGGVFNSAANYASTVAGGDGNFAGGARSAIGGGAANQAMSDNSVVGGGVNNNIGTNSPDASIGGGNANTILQGSQHSAIGGGRRNTIISTDCTIAGGTSNTIGFFCPASTIGGGTNNLVDSSCPYSTIAGAFGNYIQAGIEASDVGSTIGGGFQNVIYGSDNYATIGGGFQNVILGSGNYATVPGGYHNSAVGSYTFAAGQNAHADHDGSFVWSDFSSSAIFATTGLNQFLVRAAGGARFWGGDHWDVTGTEGDFRIGTDAYRLKIGVALTGGGSGDVWIRAQGGTARMFLKTPGGITIFSNEGQTSGVSVAAGGGAWSALSDRNAKENFTVVNSREILEQVASLPLTSWNYKSQEKAIRHIGPMAQDFALAFHVGEDDKHITTVDADGVAFAAIQGLNQKVEQRESEIHELKARLADLETLVRTSLSRKESAGGQ